MGNSPFDPLVTSNVSSINQQIPWSKEFTLLDKQPLNSSYILHHIPSNSSFKVKHMTLNKTQHSQIFRQIDMRKNTPSPFVTKLQKTQMYTVKGYCSQHEEVFLMYRYVETNLKQEILNRRFRNERFFEQEIKVILQAGVKGISYLNEMGLTPKGLNASQILLTPQRAVLLNDPWLSVGSTMSRSIQAISSKQQINQMQNGSNIFSIPVQDYPSPQKILFMNDLIQEYNEWLSELFTFGLIVLETIFMESLTQQLYDKSQKKIYYHKVKQKIQEITSGLHLNKDANIQQNLSNDSTTVLSEIKQDLRRLLSHQPRLRESVYLKYKKNHASYLFLKKPKEEFRQNASLVKDNNLNSFPQDKFMKLNNYEQANNPTMNQTVSLNKEIYTIKKQTNHHDPHQYEIGSKYSKIIEQAQKLQDVKPSWMVNNMAEGPQNAFNKVKQSSNKLRVVSSSLPHGLQPNNQLKINPHPSIEAKNNKIISSPITSEYFIYNQFNNQPTDSLNKNHQYHHLGGIHRLQQNKPPPSFQPKLTPIIPQANTSYLASQRQNQFIPTDYITSKNYLIPTNYQNNNKFQLPNTYKNLSYLTQTKGNSSFYGLNNIQSYKPVQISKNIRTVELSPKKQTLVQKQPQSKPQYWMENIEKTTPSSRYISTSSSNNYQPPANQIFSSQTYKSHIPTLKTDYTSNIFSQFYTNNTKPVTNFSSYDIVRSESSYIFKRQNSEPNNLFTGKFPETKRQSWTYEGMIGKDDFMNNKFHSYQEKVNSFLPATLPQYQNEQAKNNDNDKEQAKTVDDMKRPPSKISLSQTYNKYSLSNTNSNNNLKQNPSDQYQTSTLTSNAPYTPQLEDPSQQKPASYAFGETKNYSRFSPNYQNKSPITTTDTYPQELPKIPSSKELNNFQFREVGSLYYEDSHFLNDKESIVIESYTGSMSKLPSNRTQTHMSNQNSFNIPKMPSKESFEINHSMIGNVRNEGKSFSSMDEDVKELRKFGQQKEVYEKKPNSVYSSSEKMSLIDRIYEPQVMESQGRESFDQSPKKEQQEMNGQFRNRSSQIISRSSQQKIPNARQASQSYLQTPERYPGKERMNSTIREASCEESGVNNSNSESYENSRVHPNTQISKYQAHEERRLSERKVQEREKEKERERQKERENDPALEQNMMKETSFFSNHNNNNNKDITSNPTTNLNPKNDTLTKANPTEQKVTLYADGSRYIGETDQNGESHGFGVLYYPDGQVAYQGEWLHGDFNGKGKLYNPYQLQMEKSYDYRDLSRMDEFIKDFEGVFSHDVKEGRGVLRMHNNEVYEGQFSGELPHGRGKFNCWNGNVVEGIWEKGLLSGTF